MGPWRSAKERELEYAWGREDTQSAGNAKGSAIEVRAAVARLTAGASQRGAKGLRAMKEASDLAVRQPLTVLGARVVSWPEAGSDEDFESRIFRIFATDRGSMPLQGLFWFP